MPAPPPPDDFAALQYIDAAGCVFEREDREWAPRLDKAGGHVCGFPPTFSSRRTDPQADRILPLGTPAAEPTAEDLLIEALASGLRAGEFTADPRPAETRREAEPAKKSALTVELEDMVAQQGAFEAAVAPSGSAPTGLCGKLGYVTDPDGRPALGQDVTLGLCPGMRATTVSARVQEGARGVSEIATASGNIGSGETARDVGSEGRALTPQAEVRPAAGASVVARRADGKAHRANTVEMIPASARYVQVGLYADAKNASGAIRRLSGLGYPVSQSYARRNEERVQVILAGPFRDRQSLIEALSRLRANGYPRAAAR